MISHNDKLFEVYKSNAEIVNAAKNIALKINAHYSNTNSPVLLLGILNGCIPFFSELSKHLSISYEYSFLKVSSYKDMQRGTIKLDLDVSANDVLNKDILIVEDIVDTGETLRFLTKHLWSYNPHSICVSSIFVRNKSIDMVDFYGFLLKNNKYVIGYGMDINNLFRDLNDIYIEKSQFEQK